MMYKLPALLVALSLSIFSTPLYAESFYVGAGIGQASSNLDSTFFGNANVDDTDTDTGWKVFGGYKINEYFSLEGGYFDAGKTHSKTPTPTPGKLLGQPGPPITTSSDFTTYSLSLIIGKQFGRLYPFFKVGYHWWESKGKIDGTNAPVLNAPPPPPFPHYFKQDGSGLLYGVGANYIVTDSFEVRVEFEKYKTDTNYLESVDFFSAGLIARF